MIEINRRRLLKLLEVKDDEKFTKEFKKTLQDFENVTQIEISKSEIIYELGICCVVDNLERYLVFDEDDNETHINQCIQIASFFNPYLTSIRYIIEKRSCNLNIFNNKNCNCLQLACWGNENVEIIKYYIDDHNFNPNEEDINLWNSLHYACSGNNLETVKYLIENQEMNPSKKSHDGDCLEIACHYTANPLIIEYLLNKGFCLYDKPSDESYINILIQNNIHPNVLKYVIEELKCDFQQIDIGDTLLELLINPGYIYFLKSTELRDPNTKLTQEIITNIIQIIKKYNLKGNILSQNILTQMHYDDICVLKSHQIYVNIGYPKEPENTKCLSEFVFNKNSLGPIFEINSKTYYGHVETIYNKCLVLKSLLSTDEKIISYDDNDNEIIHFKSGDKYIYKMSINGIDSESVEMFLRICYLDKLDIINNLSLSEIIKLTKIFEILPTNYNVNTMEYYICKKYTPSEYDEYLLKICDKYNLKYLKGIM